MLSSAVLLCIGALLSFASGSGCCVSSCDGSCRTYRTNLCRAGKCCGYGAQSAVIGGGQDQCSCPYYNPIMCTYEDDAGPEFVVTNCTESHCPGTISSEDCSVTCSEGNVGTPRGTCSGGKVTFAGCGPPQCTAASDAAYNTTQCQGTLSAEECVVECSDNYIGDPVVTCNSDSGGPFEMKGCNCDWPRCTISADDQPWYKVSEGCDSTCARDCSLVCSDNALGQANQPICDSDGGSFTLQGCTPKSCMLSNVTAAYTVHNCTGSHSVSTCDVGCAAGYSGSAVVGCPVDQGEFMLSGCVPVCDSSTATTIGYDVTSCPDGSPVADCMATCATGYHGNVTVSCPAHEGAFTLEGCNLTTCNNDGMLGYVASQADCPSGSVPADCTATCKVGYSETAAGIVVACETHGGPFSATGCEPDTCNKPSIGAAYQLVSCVDGSTVNECDILCKSGGRASVLCKQSGSAFEVSGCTEEPTKASSATRLMTSSAVLALLVASALL